MVADHLEPAEAVEVQTTTTIAVAVREVTLLDAALAIVAADALHSVETVLEVALVANEVLKKCQSTFQNLLTKQNQSQKRFLYQNTNSATSPLISVSRTTLPRKVM